MENCGNGGVKGRRHSNVTPAHSLTVFRTPQGVTIRHTKNVWVGPCAFNGPSFSIPTSCVNIPPSGLANLTVVCCVPMGACYRSANIGYWQTWAATVRYSSMGSITSQPVVWFPYVEVFFLCVLLSTILVLILLNQTQ